MLQHFTRAADKKVFSCAGATSSASGFSSDENGSGPSPMLDGHNAPSVPTSVPSPPQPPAGSVKPQAGCRSKPHELCQQSHMELQGQQGRVQRHSHQEQLLSASGAPGSVTGPIAWGQPQVHVCKESSSSSFAVSPTALASATLADRREEPVQPEARASQHGHLPGASHPAGARVLSLMQHQHQQHPSHGPRSAEEETNAQAPLLEHSVSGQGEVAGLQERMCPPLRLDYSRAQALASVGSTGATHQRGLAQGSSEITVAPEQAAIALRGQAASGASVRMVSAADPRAASEGSGATTFASMQPGHVGSREQVVLSSGLQQHPLQRGQRLPEQAPRQQHPNTLEQAYAQFMPHLGQQLGGARAPDFQQRPFHQLDPCAPDGMVSRLAQQRVQQLGQQPSLKETSQGPVAADRARMEADVRARLGLPPKRGNSGNAGMGFSASPGQPGMDVPGSMGQVLRSRLAGNYGGMSAGAPEPGSPLQRQVSGLPIGGGPSAALRVGMGEGAFGASDLGHQQNPFAWQQQQRRQEQAPQPPHQQRQAFLLQQQPRQGPPGQNSLLNSSPDVLLHAGGPFAAFAAGPGALSIERTSSAPQAAIETQMAAARLRRMEQMGISPSQAVLAVTRRIPDAQPLRCRLGGSVPGEVPSGVDSPLSARSFKRSAADCAFEGDQHFPERRQQGVMEVQLRANPPFGLGGMGPCQDGPGAARMWPASAGMGMSNAEQPMEALQALKRRAYTQGCISSAVHGYPSEQNDQMEAQHLAFACRSFPTDLRVMAAHAASRRASGSMGGSAMARQGMGASAAASPSAAMACMAIGAPMSDNAVYHPMPGMPQGPVDGPMEIAEPDYLTDPELQSFIADLAEPAPGMQQASLPGMSSAQAGDFSTAHCQSRNMCTDGFGGGSVRAARRSGGASLGPSGGQAQAHRPSAALDEEQLALQTEAEALLNFEFD